MDALESPQDEGEATPASLVKPPVETLIGRALRLKCPRCGNGRLFTGWFRMPDRCSGCNLKYERAPGYFLGSAYINYGLSAILLIVLYPALHFGVGWTNQQLAPWLAVVVVVFPLLAFRYARALWLALDCQFDQSVYED